MTNQEREKLIFDLIDKDKWDDAIEHAKHIPVNHDIFQRLPTATEDGMPNHAINKVLDHLEDHGINNSGFLFEMSHNLLGHNDAPTLQRLARFAHDKMPGSYTATKDILSHPNFKHTEEDEQMLAPQSFWSSYERKVEPHHFAAIKSIFSGEPETINHRNKTGNSHDFYIHQNYVYDLKPESPVHSFDKPKVYNGSYTMKIDHALPHIRAYASKIQDKIINDPDITKRYLKGQPYIKVHRGIGGMYSKQLRNSAGYDETTGNYDSKTVTVPTAPFSSWTTDFEMACRFAKGRGGDLDMPGQGSVISKWMPVSDVLHSGHHTVIPGSEGVHPSEKEIIFGHPTGQMKLKTDEIHFEMPHETEDRQFQPGTKREKMAKGMKEYGVALATATAMLGIPKKLATPEQEYIDIKKPEMASIETQSKTEVKPLPGLKYIEMIETSGGKNLNHKEVKSGLNTGTKAIGKYGLMPLQVKEIVAKDKKIAEKYPHILDYNHLEDQHKIHEEISKNPSLEVELANSHWNRLYHRFNGNENKMAHAWFNGITGTTSKRHADILEHPYVKKYQKYKKLLQLERAPASFKKSESYLSPETKNITAFRAADNTNPDISGDINEINELIQAKAFHAIPKQGLFTSDSFILGNQDGHSWLMKVESGDRPAIMSSKSGLQTVKEAAAYDIIENVFKLDGITPEAILGEVDIAGDKKPATAIKMLPDTFKLAVDLEDEYPGKMFGITESYRQTGMLHKMAAVLYILGDGDSHGKNVMTDNTYLKLIDHGSSFADEKFDPSSDENIFIPYILRIGRIKDYMDRDEKLKNMPKIDKTEIKQQVKSWLLATDYHMLEDKLNKYGIDPKPTVDRLKKLQSNMPNVEDVDNAINEVWV